jgi:hypothetical protein
LLHVVPRRISQDLFECFHPNPRARWILIESADDIQADLLQHANGAGSTRLSALRPTGFSYEVCDASTRGHRREALMKQYVPLFDSGGSLRTDLE